MVMSSFTNYDYVFKCCDLNVQVLYYKTLAHRLLDQYYITTHVQYITKKL